MISVIIPLYNKEKIVDECIKSVLIQDYSDFELIIVDDGSTDDSVNIVLKFNDDRIRFFSKTNGGVSDARNFGILQANSENIFFLDADDIIMPNCLSTLSNLMIKYDNAFIYHCNFIVEGNSHSRKYCSRTIEGEILNPQELIWNGEIFPRPGAMIIKKTCFENIGFFSTKISRFEDLEIIIKLLRFYKSVYSPEIVMIYQIEFSDESKKPTSIEKEFAFYMNFRNACFYERLILSWNLFIVLKDRKKFGDNIAIKIILKKYILYLHYIALAIIIMKIRYYKIKIKKIILFRFKKVQ